MKANELIKRIRKKQKVKKVVNLGVILLIGLFILNYKSIFATKGDLVSSADKMSSYIIAEYQRQ